MKKTKLLTSLAAFVLVLGLGACELPEEETTSDESGEVSTTDTEDTSEGETTPEGGNEPVAYAIVGDFDDNSWNESPATDSVYYIPAGTEHYEATVEVPTADDLGYEPSFRVVEYGTWNLVADYDNLDVDNSTGVTGSHGNDNNIELAGGTYDLVFDFGETNSILVTLQTGEGGEGEKDDEAWKLNTEYLFGMEIDGTLYYSDSGAYSSTFFYEGTLTTTYQTAGIFTVSEGDNSNGYYITTTYYGTTEYVSLDTYTDNNGNEGQYLQFVTEPTLIYWDDTNECWTNKDGSYFLGSYLYQSRNEYYLYAQPIESIASYSVARLIEIPATPTSLVISGETEVTAGETIQLTVTANEGAFDAVIWESSNSEIATVAQDGTVSGLKAGSVTISATSTRDANVKATYAVEVKAAETGVLLEYEITSEKLQAEFGLGVQEDISGRTSTYSGFSVEWTGGTGNGIKPWGSAPSSAGGYDTIRVYSGNSFTIKDGDAHVSKIVIQCSGTTLSSNGCVKLSVNSNATMGSVTSAGTNVDQVEITVNEMATSTTITSSGTAYICSIVVYYTF